MEDFLVILEQAILLLDDMKKETSFDVSFFISVLFQKM